jgi:hypothetical protein
VLVASQGSAYGQFKRYLEAPRWHARLCSDARPTLAEALLALAALHMLRGPSAAAGGEALVAICRGHRLDDATGVLDAWLDAQERKP